MDWLILGYWVFSLLFMRWFLNNEEENYKGERLMCMLLAPAFVPLILLGVFLGLVLMLLYRER